MDIVQIGPDDTERFLAFRRAALAGDPASFRATSADDEATGPAAWRERLARDHVVVLKRDGDWLAMGGVGQLAGERLAHKGLVWGMYVSPAARGSGAGDAILAALEAAARTRGLRQLQLTLMADNVRARRLYERKGFVVYATEPESVRHGDRYADEALMWKRL